MKHRLPSLWPWLLLAGLLAACSEPRALDRQELKRNALRADGLELRVLAESDSPMAGLAERLVREIKAQGNYAGELEVVEWDAPASQDRMRLCIGLSSEPRLLQLLSPLDVEALEAGGFSYRGQRYTQPGDALLACLPDPMREGLPMMVLLGVEASALARRELGLPAPWIPRVITWQGAGPGVQLELESDGSPRLASLREPIVERERVSFAAPRALDPQLLLLAGPGLDRARQADYLQRCQGLRSKLEAWFARPLTQPITLHLYAHVEDMQRALGRVELSLVDAGSLSVHVLLAPGVPDDGGAGLARALALGIAGQPRQAWLLEALGTAAAERWWGRDLQTWGAHLTLAGLRLERSQATDPAARLRYSPHILGPTRAWYLREALRVAGQPGQPSLSELWLQPSEAVQASPPSEVRGHDLGPPPAPLASARREQILGRKWRGVALFAGEAPGGASVYAQRALEKALDQAAALGATSYSVSVRVADDDPIAWLSAGSGGPWASTSDAVLGSVLGAGRARGMGSMLVLDPLLGAGQGRVDLGHLSTEAGRALFLRRLRLFSLHYGLLGELLGLDILCLGTSLDQGASTLLGERDLGKPVMLERKTELLAGWVEVIERTRAAFGGALTYAAHMGTPLYQTNFWEHLDFIGLLGFGPQKPEGFDQGGASVTDKALKTEVQRQLRKGQQFEEKFGRPPLFVQLGFPARDGSWDDWTSSRGAADPAAQERFYRALEVELRDFDRRAKPANFFLWNWSVDESPRPGASADFSVRGRLPNELLGQLLSLQ